MSMVRMQAKEKAPSVRKRRPSSAGSHAPKTLPQISGMLNHNTEPGGPEWQFCNLPLSKELAQGLAGKWPGIEGTYIGTMKGVFRLLRSEREAICQYFYHRRLATNSCVPWTDTVWCPIHVLHDSEPY